ncbi:hypothetical protein [Ferruginibacter sp. HRS2-29]|uniref:hypothetical protein n=2 Tax=Ferruginibacter sp. HRS2-29 TaxID=2487334 RepID=UPI0020CDB531|nr:hypothetical protein [Ferruginibacter sp. HRS2-29]MCP9751198.1 hypothetical protein [Ferruginibacter sp. HRS2-29]
MKLSIKKSVVFVLSLFFCLQSFCQYPPAQGPQPVIPGTGVKELPLFIVTNLLKIKMRDSIIPAINAAIRAQGPPVSITVSAVITQRKPTMAQTQYIDQPNSKYVTMPYKVDYKLNISGYPDRHVFQNLSIDISSKDWYANQGGMLTFSLNAEKPYLDGPSFAEQALNFFIGNRLTSLVDSKIRSYLPNAIRQALPVTLLDRRCNRLNVVVPSNDAPEYQNSYIQYQYKPVRNQGLTVLNTINVSVKSIRRLKARNYEANTILYDSSENINIEFFANNKLQTFDVQQIREDQVRNFPDNNMVVAKPASTGSLILLATITQSNFLRESRYVEFKVNKSFGNGTQKLIVQKTFISKPFQLPGGGMSKPQTIPVDAYEFTVQVTVHNQELGVSQ